MDDGLILPELVLLTLFIAWFMIVMYFIVWFILGEFL